MHALMHAGPTEWVLGLDGAVGGEGLRLSLGVDGGHPEVVHLSLLEAGDVEGERPLVARHLPDLHPPLRPRVQLLDLVLLWVGSIGSSINFWIRGCKRCYPVKFHFMRRNDCLHKHLFQ